MRIGGRVRIIKKPEWVGTVIRQHNGIVWVQWDNLSIPTSKPLWDIEDAE